MGSRAQVNRGDTLVGMNAEDVKHQNELTLRAQADQAARIAQDYAALAKKAAALENPAPGAQEGAERGEQVHLDAAARWQREANDAPADRLLTPGELWDDFMRRNNEWDGLGPAPG
jgi:hypothetical protein